MEGAGFGGFRFRSPRAPPKILYLGTWPSMTRLTGVSPFTVTAANSGGSRLRSGSFLREKAEKAPVPSTQKDPAPRPPKGNPT